MRHWNRLKSLGLYFFVLSCAALVFGCGGKSSTPVTKDPSKPFLPVETGTPGTPSNNAGNPGTVSTTSTGTPPAPGATIQAAPTAPPSTAFCSPGSDGSYPSSPQASSGHESNANPEYDWAIGGTCIHRPIEDVWGVLRNQPLMVWENMDSSTATPEPSTGNVIYTWDVHYVKNWGPFSFPWDLMWYHTVTSGTVSEPLIVLVNYQRISGSDHISYWEGSISLTFLQDEVTGVYLINQIHADTQGPSDSQKTIETLMNKMATGTPVN